VAGNKESLKRRVDKIRKNPLLAKRMGQKAREIIIKKDLDISDHVKKLEEYYINIIDK